MKKLSLRSGAFGLLPGVLLALHFALMGINACEPNDADMDE
jgi:hypothetical protein